MSPLAEHKKWLQATAKRFQVPKKALTNGRAKYQDSLLARQVFYALCIMNGISLYDVSRYYGKNRTTMYNSYKAVEKHVAKSASQIAKQIIEQLKAV